MTTPGQYPGDQHSVTADELLAAMIAGARMEILARAAAAASQDLKVPPVADQIHATNPSQHLHPEAPEARGPRRVTRI